MKFLRIKYRNYRCFRDVEVYFDTNAEKNISLVIAPNGGGKTEMLFSFWWVLYGFDFEDLKGKDATPYSLNSRMYLDVMNHKIESAICYVELEFESDGVIYTMKRSEVFSLHRNGSMKSEQFVEFYNVNPNGTSTTPIRDKEQVKNQLTRILPVSILHGIIFDGERMKQLASKDEDSKKAIEGIIRQITNEELFNLCIGELGELSKIIVRQKTQLAKNAKNTTLAQIEDEISRLKEELRTDDIKLQSNKDRLEVVKNDLENVSRELRQHRESREFEKQRSRLKKDLEARNKELSSAIEDFYKSLSDGYILICDKLFSDVKYSLEQYDIPVGLTVEAVRSILQRPKCICGHDIGPEEIERMNQLIQTLPPDNINSTIHEMVRQAKLSQDKDKQILDKSYDRLAEIEDEITSLKKEIALISTQISENAPQIIKDLESRYNSLVIEQSDLEREIDRLKNQNTENSNKITQLVKSKASANTMNDAYNLLEKKDQFIQKCLRAFKEIDEYNKVLSLKSINEKIDAAYASLSEDYSRGRRVCIGQYAPDLKYRILSYYLSDYDNTLSTLQENGTIAALKTKGDAEDEIKEYVISKAKTSSSTGQSKINTLAFAKAILDYSNEERDENSTEISRDYPFLIDSPFTELANDNLEHSADNIHLFSGQIILLISEESYERTKVKILPHVYSRVKLTKQEGESYSFIAQ